MVKIYANLNAESVVLYGRVLNELKRLKVNDFFFDWDSDDSELIIEFGSLGEFKKAKGKIKQESWSDQDSLKIGYRE